MATPIKAETMENPTPFTTDHLGEQLHRHDNVKRGGDLGGLEALVGEGFGDLATARQKAEQEAPPDDPPVSTDKDAPEKSEPGSEDRDADAGEDPGQQQKGDEDDPYADRNFYDDDDDFGETEDWNQFNQTLDDAIEDAEEGRSDAAGRTGVRGEGGGGRGRGRTRPGGWGRGRRDRGDRRLPSRATRRSPTRTESGSRRTRVCKSTTAT